eukprot:scaffold134995_cov74-Attheya_sp.AAC.2
MKEGSLIPARLHTNSYARPTVERFQSDDVACNPPQIAHVVPVLDYQKEGWCQPVGYGSAHPPVPAGTRVGYHQQHWNTG